MEDETKFIRVEQSIGRLVEGQERLMACYERETHRATRSRLDHLRRPIAVAVQQPLRQVPKAVTNKSAANHRQRPPPAVPTNHKSTVPIASSTFFLQGSPTVVNQPNPHHQPSHTTTLCNRNPQYYHHHLKQIATYSPSNQHFISQQPSIYPTPPPSSAIPPAGDPHPRPKGQSPVPQQQLTVATATSLEIAPDKTVTTFIRPAMVVPSTKGKKMTGERDRESYLTTEPTSEVAERKKAVHEKECFTSSPRKPREAIMKISRLSNPQHINELPEDLVENILSRMPLCDAVRTSVLSKKWRYAWSKLPRLVFDNRWYENERSFIERNRKLIYAFHKVLVLHQGPLHEFTPALSGLSGSSDIDHFILYVLRKGVKKLSVYIVENKPYRFPSSIFSYDQQLTQLELSYGLFEPPQQFNGFSKLESLRLKEVGISGSRLSALISNSPLLKNLIIKSSTNCGSLKIVSPNLEFLSFEGLCEFICFDYTPKLSNLSIYTDSSKRRLRSMK